MLPKFLTRFFTKKRIALFLVVCCLLSVLTARPILAFSTRGLTYQFTFENAVFGTDEMNLQSFVYETLKATAGSVVATIYCFSCEDRNMFRGLLGFTGNLIAGIYGSPPASGVQYLAHLGNKLGIVQPAYAQAGTIGWNAMESLLPVWSAFRDLAYSLFVIIFIFIGFAIMFRLKISPQAVITIESALPKIIVALLLVTFSYAIVGFLIDLMYVLFGLITFIFLGDNGIIPSQFGGILAVVLRITELVGGKMGSAITQSYFLNGVFLTVTAIIAFFFALLNGPGGWIIGLLGIIVGFLALLRCLWTLIKAWAMVIVNLIFAPFIITMGALPGSNAIGSWLRTLLANLAVLPIMYTMFMLCCYFILLGMSLMFEDLGTALLSLATGYLGPVGISIGSIIMVLSPSDFWQFLSALLMPIIGLMMLWMAPKASDMIQSFLMGKPFAYGTAIGEAVGPVLAGAQAGIQYRYGAVEKEYQWLKGQGLPVGRRKKAERALYQALALRGKLKGET